MNPKTSRLTRPNSRGFTYVELLVVTLIIGIMYLIMFGPSSDYMVKKRKAACARNLQQLWLALNVYAADNNSRFPPAGDAKSSGAALQVLVPGYTSDTTLFWCPGRGEDAPSDHDIAHRRIGYAYYAGLPANPGATQPLITDEQTDATPKKTGAIAFSPNGRGRGANHRGKGGNILFPDGSVTMSDPTLKIDLPVPPGTTLLNP